MTRSWSASAAWAAPRPGSSAGAGSACWVWSASTFLMLWGRPTASRASSACPTTRTRPMFPSCTAPTRDGGIEGGEVFNGALASARLHGLPHEVLTGAEVNARFPGYNLAPQARAVFQPQGGYVMSERAIVAHVRAAQAEGAEIHAREQV